MKVIKNSFVVLVVTLVVCFGFASMAMAQVLPVDEVGGGGGDLIGWITTMLQYLIALAGIVAAAVLIFNGFTYITASGDEGKITKATKGITYAIVGLIIAAISFLIVNFVIGQIEKSAGTSNAGVEIVELVS